MTENEETQVPELRAISCFSGSAMLDLGADLALRRLGYRLRTVLYVEQNPYAIDLLIQRQRDGLIDRAPIWGDVRTLFARSLRGLVDVVIGGFPCQDVSVAGRGHGLAGGTRSGLFFDLLGIAVDSGAGLILLENVAGLRSTASSVGDGEYSAAGIVVVQSLAEKGFRCKWLDLAAEDVGAPHGRERWWCVAWKPLADAERDGLAAGAVGGSDAGVPSAQPSGA